MNKETTGTENGCPDMIISYLTIRQTIGWLGIALPIVVVVLGFIPYNSTIQGSISAYYHTNMQDFFVGLMCCVGLFLISYKGYEKEDNLVTNISGILAFGVAFFPTDLYPGHAVTVGIFNIDERMSKCIHLTCAVLFFGLLAYNSIRLFVKTKGRLTEKKKTRNRLYGICGWSIVASLVCILAIEGITPLRDYCSKFHPILIFECTSLWAFGISWLTKGETWLIDEDDKFKYSISFRRRVVRRYKKAEN